MAAPGEAADPRAIPAHHQPIAVMFDLMNPERTGRRSGYLRRQAWLDETGGQGHDRSIGQRPGGMEGFERLIRPRTIAEQSSAAGRMQSLWNGYITSPEWRHFRASVATAVVPP